MNQTMLQGRLAIFRINYKSDFIITLNSDAGWMTPFCIKFWTGAPSQAYFAGWDGTTYTNCAPVAGEPTKLQVQFDDHHLPIGELKYQIGYHFTVADFPTTVEDEVLNQERVVINHDGQDEKVLLDFNGETAPDIQFSLPAYANEAQRIANEEQRIANEAIRIVNEEVRIVSEQTRQQNEEQRIAQETARVQEFARLKRESESATSDATAAATLANTKAQLAADNAALAQSAADLANAKAQLAADKAALAASAAQLANDKAALAQQKAEYAQTQGTYAKNQGDYAKQQGNYAKDQGDTALADHLRAEADHETAASDHTRAESDHSTASSDHTQASTDHSTATSDHSTAAADHTQAGTDHTRAESDHSTAASDHTTAGNDHTRAESDHTRAESDHAAVEVYVDSLGAYDISAAHAVGGVLATYANLQAALGTNGANIPEGIRKGGMSVKFIQGSAQRSDNKYVQYRLMSDSFNTTVSDWQGIDSEIKDLSKNLIESGATALAIKQRCALIQEFHKVWSGQAYNINNGKWGANADYGGVEMFFVYYNHKYVFNLPVRYVIHFDADGNFLRRKSFTTPITEYTAGYTDVVYIGININISDATLPVFTVKDITTTPIEDLQEEVASIHDDITSINDDIESISTKEISGDAISITPLTPTMGSWVNNAAINTPLSFRENAGDTYGHIRIDLTQFNRVGQILAHDFSCMVSTQPGLLVEAVFVNSDNVVIQLHTKESESSAGGVANRTYNVPNGAVAVYLNYRSTDNTTAEYKTYHRKVGSSNLTSELLDKIKSKLQGKTLYNDGDSVAHGASGEVPYAEQIATLMGMTLTNAAVSGTTIGYKDSDPNYTQSIPERMIANLTNNDYDYILFEGGFNDIAHCQIGEITEGFQPATIDPMTTIGGLEKVCQWLWLNKPTAKKLFVLGQKYNYNAQKPFWEAIITVLEKWGIPYVDIWRETQLIGYNSTNKARWYHDADGLHPNTAAYANFFNDLIISKLESL